MIRNIHIWMADYLRQAARRQQPFEQPTHVFFCFCDHYEPLWHGATPEQGLERVRHWCSSYPKFAKKFRDADGRVPQHTFFYPAEEYRPELLDPIAQLCADGFGEAELHLHHDNDTAENLTSTIEIFKKRLRSHGFLPSGASGKIRYGFIHGNWSLDNSRGDGRWCGVNNELQVLRDTGCYADFTLPSAPSDTQTRKINSIYYATDDPDKPKSHDTGIDAHVGTKPSGDLLLIQGPLGLNWRERKWGLLPRIEHADVAGHTPVTQARVDLWIYQRIGVLKKTDWIFVKVHTHGCQENNLDAVFGTSAERMHEYLQRRYNDGNHFILHYVTAREMYNLVRAAEAGQSTSPNSLRDFELPKPPIRQT